MPTTGGMVVHVFADDAPVRKVKDFLVKNVVYMGKAIKDESGMLDGGLLEDGETY